MRSVPWNELYKTKLMTAAQAIQKIRPGDRIFIGTGCGQPQMLVESLVKDNSEIADAEIYHFLTQGEAPYIGEEFAKKFRTCSFFLAPNVREGIVQGRGDYIPIFLGEIPSLFKSGRIPLDVALIQTSPPDKYGNLSLGISVDIVKAAVENSLYIVAEVNEKMPRTLGESFISLNQVDAVVESQKDILEYTLPPIDPVTDAIATNIASLIEDGSTIEAGIGRLPQAALRYLLNKKNLGMHTEMFCDAIIPLIENNVLNGSRKTINRGKITASFCLGTRKLYDYIRENPIFEFRPSDYVNDPFVIAQHQRMVAINEALEVDMTGQVCSDSMGYAFYGGVGGQADFTRGASRSKEGKAIIALPSMSQDGKNSRIVPRLTEGAGTVLSRADIHYVVTEYGIADLFGKNVRERVLALAEIAHPDYRNEILKEAKKWNYVYSYQKELPIGATKYPHEQSTTTTLTDGTRLLFRPVKPTDDKALRDMFYALSEKSIAFRFYQQIKSFDPKFIQGFMNVDFSKDMAIAAFIQDFGGEQIVGIAHYYLNKSTNKAEVSFLVRDDWQGKGIGTHLLEILTGIARKRGIAGFDAKVRAQNQLMLSIFYNSGYKITTKLEEETYLISYEFKEKGKE
jgi:acyl-CoA hydrolase/GNAT superfamily N-acetyltransferase